MSQVQQAERGSNVDPDEGWSLPAWIYRDSEFYRVEVERVMRPSWQVVCHLSDVAEPGQWHTLEFLGESIVVVRGKDGAVRAFTNVCRHRGSRIVDGTSRSEEHTSALQSLMRISYAAFCLKKKK